MRLQKTTILTENHHRGGRDRAQTDNDLFNGFHYKHEGKVYVPKQKVNGCNEEFGAFRKLSHAV